MTFTGDDISTNVTDQNFLPVENEKIVYSYLLFSSEGGELNQFHSKLYKYSGPNNEKVDYIIKIINTDKKNLYM